MFLNGARLPLLTRLTSKSEKTMMRRAFHWVGAAVCATTLACGLNGCVSTVRSDNFAPSATAVAPQASVAVSDKEITDSWFYLLGRLAVLRQQRLDFEDDGFHWNELVHRKPGGVQWANPNLDVVFSEAWVAIDEDSCVLLDIPRIEGRYYTWHMLNGWGETVLNINERTFPKQPYGRYALCLKGSHVRIPAGALRIDLPVRTLRVAARVEMGDSAETAIRLQHEFKLTPLGEPKPEPVINVPRFTNAKLPRADAFDFADAILAGSPDINPGMDEVRSEVRAVTALVQSGPEGRKRVDAIIGQVALPMLAQRIRALGPVANGWMRPAVVGTYDSDYVGRSVADLVGIWANKPSEVAYFGMPHVDGSATYVQTFPKDALPGSRVRYFWSVVAVDSTQYRVIPNPLNRYILNRQSRLQPNPDGSLTLAFGPRKPDGVPESNWLPTPAGERYNLTYRLYGMLPSGADASYVPPPLINIPNQ